MSSYDEQEMEAQDVGEEEGMNDANVDETMIVVSSFFPPKNELMARNQTHKTQGRSSVQEKQPNLTRRV
jgi:hypothetical protein